MWQSSQFFLLVTLVSVAFFFLFLGLINLRRRREDERLLDLASVDAKSAAGANARRGPLTLLGGLATATLPRLAAPLLPGTGEGLTRLASRLQRAGYLQRQAPGVYLGAKVLLLTVAVLTAVLLGWSECLSVQYSVLAGCILAGLAILSPGLWLDHCTRGRQHTLRRALPDALDVIVICLEGGLSLAEAIRRVSSELQTAHPLLAREMNVVQREVLLGLSPGEAVRNLGQRCHLEEVRSLAAVLLQSERFGASITKAMRVQADQLRLKRQQRAEERAQRAAVLILFPTLLCIFPAVFLVFLGPAVIQIAAMFSKMR